MRALVWVVKCIPVRRGGDRREVGRVLARFTWLLSRGETGLMFPEGGRSRTGRVDTGATTYGVGRIVRALPGARVLCVYLRGERQETWSDAPVRGERFRVVVEELEPKSERGGLRGSIEVSQQVLGKLAEMEQEHFDGRR
jgi:1-acyl-sn-glycerol-3-phosphate acyltransferase